MQNSINVLDIGCAMGYLLAIFRNMGWQCEGVELSEYAVNYAREILGLTVRRGIINNLEFSESYFDLVTSWDVIEHSYNPKDDLRIIYRILKRGGYISLITPNRDSLHAVIAGSKWVEYEKPEEHLYFFGKRILNRILGEIGFEIIAAESVGKYVTVGFALNRLSSYSNIFERIGNLISDTIASKNIYINPLDKMFILARKL
jgi:2-polyprenyl-3-methyl-5-hydroxy-6-metoxy-1,4-benzoquinol methylase